MDEKELTAWLVERLSDERAKQDWRRLVESGWKHLRAQKLSEILPAREVEAIYAAYLLSPEKIRDLVRPAIRGLVIPAVGEIRQDHAKVGRWVPAEARKMIDALAEKKGLVQPAFIQALFKEEAIEALVNDTLYRALRDFSTIVPRLLQNISPIGKLAKLGGFGDKGGLGSRVVEEIEKRLEPEIRRFLEMGTRKALDGASRFAIDHLDDPTSLKMRKNMVGFVLEQEGAFHVQALSDEMLAEIERIAVAIAAHVASSEETRTRLHDIIGRIAAKHGARSIGEVLDELGLSESPPFDAWADVSFPAVASLVRSPDVSLWLEGLARDVLKVIDQRKT